MGALYEQTVALDAAVHMPTYARKPVMFVRGAGMRLYDDDGREHLDFVSGIGAVNLGHSHPAVTEAVCSQVAKLTHVSNLYYVEHRDELAAELVALAGEGAPELVSGGMQVFFCNSGAEANEGAIKLARKWGKAQRGAGCFRIVTAERSFHGRTMAALSATGQPSKQEAFSPLLQGFSHVPLNDLAAIEAAVTPDTCAIMLEPVQGEGGVHPCDDDYLRAVRALCDEKQILLVLDEVQTGFYRTGPAFAFQRVGVTPDIVCLAKSMANGLPVGAVMARKGIAAAFQPGDHGSTFAGGPVVCAAARATLAALAAEGMGQRATAEGAYLRDRLATLSSDTGAIADVRGVGMMNAVEFAEPIAADVAAAMLQRGLVVNSIGTSILRILPPLVCGHSEIDTLLDALYVILGASPGEGVPQWV